MGLIDNLVSKFDTATKYLNEIKKVKTFKEFREKVGIAHRNSLVYDFSSTNRAKINVFKYIGVNVGSNKFEFIVTLPLQLNPTTYKKTGTSSSKIDIQYAMKNGVGGPRPESNSITLDLYFDIVDEYKIRTMNGTIPLDINLDEVTIISDLFRYQGGGYRVLFKWGPLNYLSWISSVTCDYESFSPYGQPLSAKVTLDLQKHVLPGISDYNKEIDLSTTLGASTWFGINIQDSVSKWTSGLSSIDTDSLPNISKRIKTE